MHCKVFTLLYSSLETLTANVDEILEPLTPIWIKMGSHLRPFGSNSGAIDADMDQNVEPLTTFHLSLAQKFILSWLF